MLYVLFLSGDLRVDGAVNVWFHLSGDLRVDGAVNVWFHLPVVVGTILVSAQISSL